MSYHRQRGDWLLRVFSGKHLLALFLACVAGMGASGTVTAGETAGIARNLALCVGINGYARMGALRYCVNDAYAMRSRLAESGNFRRVKVLADLDEDGKTAPIAGLPTAGNILASLKTFAGLVPQDGTLLFFFSGHGVERGGVNYLVPVDGDETSGLSVEDIKEIMAKSKAANKLVILDACRSGLGAKGMAGVRGSLEEKQLAVLVSCGEDQFSYEVENSERSLFTLVLEEALSGKADLDGDDIITGDELLRFMDLAMGDFCLDNDILTVQTPAINEAGRDATFLRVDRSMMAKVKARQAAAGSPDTGGGAPTPRIPSLVASPGDASNTGYSVKNALDLKRSSSSPMPPPPAGGGYGNGRTTTETLDLRPSSGWSALPASAAGTADTAATMTAVDQYRKGQQFYNGNGVPTDYHEAAKWYRLAADRGHAQAQYMLGWCYNQGRGVSKNDSEAVKFYRLSAEQGYASGQLGLGTMYHGGKGVPLDYNEAVKWFRLAVDQNNTTARNWLADCYYYGRGVPQNYLEALRLYQQSASEGNARAMRDVGEMYYNAKGVGTDYYEAVKWFRQGADKGNASAQNYLGLCYELGRGVGVDYSEAIRLYNLAVAQNHDAAQSNLGKLYKEGKGVPRNYGEALRLFNASAAQGNQYAQHELGHMYYEGKGVAYNHGEAVRWFRMAADKGESCGVSKKLIGY